MYLYMLCILAVNVNVSEDISSCSYSETCMHVCVLPLAGRMRTLCNLRLQCLPYEREMTFALNI